MDGQLMKTKLLALAVALSLASSAQAQLQSQVVAGSDNGATRRILKTDSTGRLEVIGSAAGGVVYGPDTQGATPTQAPDVIGCVYYSSVTTVTTGQVTRALCDANGRIQIGGTVSLSGGSLAVTQSTSPWVVGQTTASNLNAQIVGEVANDTADSGNPVKIGGVYSTAGSMTPVTQGDRVNAQTDPYGSLRARIVSSTVTGSDAWVNTAIGMPLQQANGSSANLPVFGGYVFNGTSWDRTKSIQGVSGVGLGVTAVAISPNSASGNAITPIVSTALESSHVLCSGACNFYGVAVTSTVSGYVLVFNATSAPADGAVTPQLCSPIVGGSRVEIDRGSIPDRYSTGSTVVFSTTGCFTKTASATAMIEGRIKQ